MRDTMRAHQQTGPRARRRKTRLGTAPQHGPSTGHRNRPLAAGRRFRSVADATGPTPPGWGAGARSRAGGAGGEGRSKVLLVVAAAAVVAVIAAIVYVLLPATHRASWSPAGRQVGPALAPTDAQTPR